MRRHVRTLLQMVLLSLLLVGVSHAAPQEVNIAQSGETSLRAVLGGKEVQIAFHTSRLKKSDPGFPLALDYYDEVSVVRGMSIIVDGKTVWVPWSAYADLFYARKGFLRLEKGTFVLIIAGADGADTYSVHVSFDAKRVIKRGFYGSFAPHKPLQETLYWPLPVIE